MALDQLQNEVTSLRERAATEMRTYQSAYQDAKANKMLSQEGQQQRIDAARTTARTNIQAFAEQEVELAKQRIESIHNSLSGKMGAASADIIAVRDAQDRADDLKSQDAAITAMTRAIRGEDRSLAYAILRRAVDMGWGDVIATAGEHYPTAREAIDDLAELNTFVYDIKSTIARSMVYSLP